ncbi:diguanylate cyclase domain-containing protein [Alkalicoccus daliensis]|uniref:PAS domain S-box-containing protein/diguanylate cyclase (GGDEF) domain-containing protein n=1 Tax=Alkalicoccus daliensis TaxID=745820 RepID=A0A1H0E057_9BACI|nr:diguanylate cyclase [Alkalicoccus daliensis]SDN75718.1 PAS domain S-box-containing protein/diguanylate cyclase (GGDEF) domain-containing protein [Alkalicoccus daliensis]
MKERDYLNTIRSLPAGYAYQKLISQKENLLTYEIVDLNKKMADILQVNVSEAAGSRVHSLNSPLNKEHQYLIGKYLEAFKDKKTVRFDHYLEYLQRWFRITVTPHEAQFFSVVFYDVTSEKEPEKNENKFADNMGLLAQLDQQGNIVELSADWYSLTGYKESSLYGRNMLELIHPEDRVKSKEAFLKVIQGETKSKFINRVINKTGAVLEIEWHVFMRGSAVYCASADVTELRLKEEELNQRQVLLEELADNLPGGIFQLSVSSEGQISFPYYSRSFLAVYDISDAQFKQNAGLAFEILHPEDEQDVLTSLQAAENNNIWNAEYRIYTQDKKVRWIRGKAKSTFLNDGNVIWNGYVSDITEEKKQHLLLQESEEKMRNLYNHLPGMLFQLEIKDEKEFNFNVASEFAEELFGVSSQDILKDPSVFCNLIFSDDVKEVSNAIKKSMKSGGVFSKEYRICHPDKGIRWVRTGATPKRINESTLNMNGYVYDITELYEKEEKLKKRDKLIADISSRVPGVIFQSVSYGRDDFTFLTATGSIADLLETEISEAEMVKIDMIELLSPDDREWMLHKMNEAREKLSTFREVFRIVLPNGKEKWVYGSSVPEKMSDGGIIFSGYLNDMTEIKKYEEALKKSETRYRKLAEKMKEMAYHDELTGLPNRRLLVDRLEQQILQCGRTEAKLGLLFVDLDDFKKINDNFGHDIGDTLLIRVAERLNASVRETDTVARMAGDEFLILFTNIISFDELTAAVNGVLRALEQPIPVEDNALRVKASIGVALYPDHGNNVQELLKNADKAMYQRKHNQKDGFSVFEKNMKFL